MWLRPPMLYTRGRQPFPSAGQTETLQDMAGRTNFPPAIPFDLLFMMLIILGNLCYFDQISS